MSGTIGEETWSLPLLLPKESHTCAGGRWRVLRRAYVFLMLRPESHQLHKEGEFTDDLSCPCVTPPFPKGDRYLRCDCAFLGKDRR